MTVQNSELLKKNKVFSAIIKGPEITLLNIALLTRAKKNTNFKFLKKRRSNTDLLKIRLS